MSSSPISYSLLTILCIFILSRINFCLNQLNRDFACNSRKCANIFICMLHLVVPPYLYKRCFCFCFCFCYHFPLLRARPCVCDILYSYRSTGPESDFSSFRFPIKSITIDPDSKALVHDILAPTTAITDYAIGLGKLSATGHVYVGALMAVSL